MAIGPGLHAEGVALDESNRFTDLADQRTGAIDVEEGVGDGLGPGRPNGMPSVATRLIAKLGSPLAGGHPHGVGQARELGVPRPWSSGRRTRPWRVADVAGRSLFEVLPTGSATDVTNPGRFALTRRPRGGRDGPV